MLWRKKKILQRKRVIWSERYTHRLTVWLINTSLQWRKQLLEKKLRVLALPQSCNQLWKALHENPTKDRLPMNRNANHIKLILQSQGLPGTICHISALYITTKSHTKNSAFLDQLLDFIQVVLNSTSIELNQFPWLFLENSAVRTTSKENRK